MEQTKYSCPYTCNIMNIECTSTFNGFWDRVTNGTRTPQQVLPISEWFLVSCNLPSTDLMPTISTDQIGYSIACLMQARPNCIFLGVSTQDTFLARRIENCGACRVDEPRIAPIGECSMPSHFPGFLSRT